MGRNLEQSSAWQGIRLGAIGVACLLWPQRLLAIAAGDESRTVTTLATVPLGNLHNDNSYTPVASFRGTTYFVWVHSDNRPKVGLWRNGVLSSSYLSPNPAYTIRNDGHHYFSLGVDKEGYVHVTGDMHNYPATDMSFYPDEYKNKAIMYWVSHAPESIGSFDFVGGDAARAMPGYGFSYHSFQVDQDRELYFMARIKVHKGGHLPGEMGLGLFRYNTATRSWTALGGLAPSSPAAIYRSIAWENNGDVDAGGWYQGFRASHRFDLNNRLHFATSIWNDSTKPDPTQVLYGRSDDKGISFKRGDGASVNAPLRVEPGANQGDVVAGPGAYDLFASVAFNKAGSPLVGYTQNDLSPQQFSYKYRLPGSAWSAQVRDPFNTYIRAKYHLDANGVLTLLSPAGQYRRLNDFTSAGYNGSVGMNNNFVGIDELGLRENNDFIGLSKGTGQVSLVKLSLKPVLAPLPAPWAAANIGSVTGAVAGVFNGVDTLESASAGLGGSADNARYAWQSVSGDLDVKVRVISLAWSHDGALAGLMLRQSSAAGAKMAAAVVTYGQGAKLISRSADGVGAGVVVKSGHTAAEWLRLVKAGTVVSAYRSDDGQAWQLIGSQNVAFSGGFQVGFVQASASTAIGAARFDSFSLSSSVPPTVTAPSVTRSSTRTPSFTVTVTRSSTSTATVSKTATRTSSPTLSSTSSATPTVSASETEVESAGPTLTPSPAVELSPEASGTQSESPSGTPSPTSSRTATVSPSLTLTRTRTVLPTRSMTPSVSSTVTATVSATRTRTPVPASRTPTRTASRTTTPTASRTRTPVVIATPTPKVELRHSSADAASGSSPHHKLQLKNLDGQALDLSTIELRWWLDCDCGSEGLQAAIDWSGLVGSGQTLSATVSTAAFGAGGQTHVIVLKFKNGSLASGASAEIQFRFNRGNWAVMDQRDDYSYAAHTGLTLWDHVGAYKSGIKVWGTEPASTTGGVGVAGAKGSDERFQSLPEVLALRVGPNPALSWALVELDLPGDAEINLEVLNWAGERVLRVDLGSQPAGNLRAPINLSHLASGIYVAVLESRGRDGLQRAFFKFVVSRG